MSVAQQKKRPGLLQRLFKPRDRSSARPPRSSSRRSASRAPRQTWGYRTLCVRTCDGYYFPISHSINRSRLKTDEMVCKSMYGGAGAELFYHASGGRAERAVSRSGRRLVAEPYAFAYRSRFDESCQTELKTGLANLESVFVARADGVKSDAPARAGIGKWGALPAPAERVNTSTDPETRANLAGHFEVARVGPPDAETVVVAMADVRRLGSSYYYVEPVTIDAIYAPPDLGPEFSLFSSARASEREE